MATSEQPTASRLVLKLDRKGDTCIVRCQGKLVAGVTDFFNRELRDLISSCKRIVLDFAELSHMDSSGIGALARLYVSSKSAGCALELVNVGKPIRHLLGITHLMSVLTVIGEHNIRMG